MWWPGPGRCSCCVRTWEFRISGDSVRVPLLLSLFSSTWEFKAQSFSPASVPLLGSRVTFSVAWYFSCSCWNVKFNAKAGVVWCTQQHFSNFPVHVSHRKIDLFMSKHDFYGLVLTGLSTSLWCWGPFTSSCTIREREGILKDVFCLPVMLPELLRGYLMRSLTPTSDSNCFLLVSGALKKNIISNFLKR